MSLYDMENIFNYTELTFVDALTQAVDDGCLSLDMMVELTEAGIEISDVIDIADDVYAGHDVAVLFEDGDIHITTFAKDDYYG